MNREHIPLTRAAERLRLSYNQVMRLVHIGTLNGTQHNGRWYVSPDSIDTYQQERSAQSEVR